jgi:hypothetical protein
MSKQNNKSYSNEEIQILKEGGKRLSDILNLLGEKCIDGGSKRCSRERRHLAEGRVAVTSKIAHVKVKGHKWHGR